MKKDAYHFPHFCNARHDRKIKRIVKDYNITGYGIYFMLLEVLRDQTHFSYPLGDIDLLADEFNADEVIIRSIVEKYDLFQIDKDGNFFSSKMLLYLQPYFEKSERARDAAKIRWDKVKSDANALPRHSKCNADQNASKVKESKVNNSKVNNYRSTSDEVKLASLLGILILERKPDYKNVINQQKKEWQDWAKDIDLMIRKDNRGISKISIVIKWCQQSNFWQNNILSTNKLREQFDKLELQIESEGKMETTINKGSKYAHVRYETPNNKG